MLEFVLRKLCCFSGNSGERTNNSGYQGKFEVQNKTKSMP